ncbi:MAG: alpha/beta hydrolase [Chloroflexi bacterium AL-W]|nr:alpha/beta hydrolase [Chloroflexi bacterium AL-N1]NOK64923.1 alpha/beta hydrolase [Chloroflexi bacterium AL-N10]NOK76693.1 alpha/beta hydrolase [Chloroflexi bacterium AL-N5]NOK84584.1 alpha/beta hydrolase [Chloroflexi bacterium AL-W]NOK86591.1 alpha/beta hydrolase [Chloroflexi bacterium AL-N15]
MYTFKRYDLTNIPITYFRLPNRRHLAYARYGQPGGVPVFYFHGCPGSRLEGRPTHESAQSLGFDIFAVERPGCGFSEFASGYTTLDWVEDVAALADGFGFERFGIMGFSAGGFYVNACTFKMPERLLFAFDIGGWGPVGDEPALTAHLMPLDRFFLRRASSFGFMFRLPFSLIGLAARYMSDKGFAKALQSSMGADDRALIIGNDNMAHYFRALVKESFRQGNRGPADDAIRCYRPWGFALSDIDYPTHIWHGTDDRFANYALAEYKHAQNPRSTLVTLEKYGHLRMATIFEDILASARVILGEQAKEVME